MPKLLKIPRVITSEYLKSRVLYNPPKRVMNEGIIEELSPSGNNVRISGNWFENAGGLIVEVLPDLPKEKEKPRRSSPLRKGAK